MEAGVLVLCTLPKQLGGESRGSERHPRGVEGLVEGGCSLIPDLIPQRTPPPRLRVIHLTVSWVSAASFLASSGGREL